jgi:hypothetical protein
VLVPTFVACGGADNGQHDPAITACTGNCGGDGGVQDGGEGGVSGSSSAGESQGGTDGPTTVVTELVLRVDSSGLILQADGITVNDGLGAGDTVSSSDIAVDMSALPPGATSLDVENHSSKDLHLTGVPAVPMDIETGGSVTIATSVDVLIQSLRTTNGSVSIETAGAVRDVVEEADDDGTTPWIVGSVVTIDAEMGIGSTADALELDTDCATQDAVQLKAGEAIFVTETEGDLCIDAIVSLNSNVQLTVRNGSLLDRFGDEQADLQGASIDLVVSGGGIGTESEPVAVFGAGTGLSSNSLGVEPHVIPKDGHLFVDAYNSVHLQDVNGGLRVLQATSKIGAMQLSNIAPLAAFAGIALIPRGETLLGNPMSGSISAELGVDVTDFPVVLVPDGTGISSNTEIRLGGDLTSDDDGIVLDIQGDVDAPNVLLVGGPNIDYIQINNPKGINADGDTVVSGGDSADRVFVRAAPGHLTLQGDAGADRFYLASNANRALFSEQGGYDDSTVYVLSFVSGTLDRFGDVTIDAGEGDPGGTVDSIFVSADQSAGSLVGAIDGATLSGLGLTGTIQYQSSTPVSFFVELGSENDTLTVTEPAPNRVIVDSGSGDDVVTGCLAPNCLLNP